MEAKLLKNLNCKHKVLGSYVELERRSTSIGRAKMEGILHPFLRGAKGEVKERRKLH